MKQAHSPAQVADSAADADSRIVCQQIGLSCFRGIPGRSKQQDHSCEVHSMAIRLQNNMSA